MRLIDAESINPNIYLIPPKKFEVFQEVAKKLPTMKAIPVDKVKQAREEIWKKSYEYSGSGNEVTQAYCDGFKDSLAILDRLIESEEN